MGCGRTISAVHASKCVDLLLGHHLTAYAEHAHVSVHAGQCGKRAVRARKTVKGIFLTQNRVNLKKNICKKIFDLTSIFILRSIYTGQLMTIDVNVMVELKPKVFCD
jgi:hypothetical protein